MTHVSRFPVEKDVYFRIIDSLYRLLADLKRAQQMKEFLGDFFTKTERLMLAKRLALAGMIIEGYSEEIIRKVLKVSSGTVYRMREKLDSGSNGLRGGVKRILRHEELDEMIENLFKRGDGSGFHPLRNS